jgi:hypothetical protein
MQSISGAEFGGFQEPEADLKLSKINSQNSFSEVLPSTEQACVGPNPNITAFENYQLEKNSKCGVDFGDFEEAEPTKEVEEIHAKTKWKNERAWREAIAQISLEEAQSKKDAELNDRSNTLTQFLGFDEGTNHDQKSNASSMQVADASANFSISNQNRTEPEKFANFSEFQVSMTSESESNDGDFAAFCSDAKLPEKDEIAVPKEDGDEWEFQSASENENENENDTKESNAPQKQNKKNECSDFEVVVSSESKINDAKLIFETQKSNGNFAAFCSDAKLPEKDEIAVPKEDGDEWEFQSASENENENENDTKESNAPQKQNEGFSFSTHIFYSVEKFDHFDAHLFPDNFISGTMAF